MTASDIDSVVETDENEDQSVALRGEATLRKGTAGVDERTFDEMLTSQSATETLVTRTSAVSLLCGGRKEETVNISRTGGKGRATYLVAKRARRLLTLRSLAFEGRVILVNHSGEGAKPEGEQCQFATATFLRRGRPTYGQLRRPGIPAASMPLVESISSSLWTMLAGRARRSWDESITSGQSESEAKQATLCGSVCIVNVAGREGRHGKRKRKKRTLRRIPSADSAPV